MFNLKKSLLVAAVAGGLSSAAYADTTTLRIQTHFSPETHNGKAAAKWAEDVTTMSGGDIQLEMFYSSSVVKSVETFDAAVNGILDCDMTGGSYQVGKNKAFQFTGDLMGGYSNPYQMLGWLLHNGGREAVNELYNSYDMQFVGWWVPGPESLSSTKPIRNVGDFKDWKFRSPPGLATLVFANLGASPIVMDFNEIFTALETGLIDGADAANVSTNVGLGLYDIASHTNYPGFHSMPADHLACNKKVWDKMSDAHKRILEVSMESLALRIATETAIMNAKTAQELADKGVNLYDWSAEDLDQYRAAVKAGWEEFADNDQAKALLQSHIDFLVDQGAMQ
ncbi:MAG: TRAP transporter substrate-binding protein [Gammaproteobacteria bacterium]|nr:TRAP transporter substrate-binding protein [Gammaproteobacteria bacterium]